MSNSEDLINSSGNYGDGEDIGLVCQFIAIETGTGTECLQFESPDVCVPRPGLSIDATPTSTSPIDDDGDDFPIGLAVGVPVAAIAALFVGAFAYKKYAGRFAPPEHQTESPATEQARSAPSDLETSSSVVAVPEEPRPRGSQHSPGSHH